MVSPAKLTEMGSPTPTAWFTLVMVQPAVPVESVPGAAVVHVCAVAPLPSVKVSARPATGTVPESVVSVAETARFCPFMTEYGAPFKARPVSSSPSVKGAEPLDPLPVGARRFESPPKVPVTVYDPWGSMGVIAHDAIPLASVGTVVVHVSVSVPFPR